MEKNMDWRRTFGHMCLAKSGETPPRSFLNDFLFFEW
jgi:hypothetical protein